IHMPIAESAGIARATIEAIAGGSRPAGINDDEAMIHDFCIELARDKGVSDRTFDQVRARFGEQGVVDLAGINGYYTLLAMVMNVAGTPAATVPPIPLTVDASR
ncbi:MAG TPA: carboxymuconolactone decarboxylase family protein, partial [Casimicrobiaceae bacterium]|nr:carboxymuconolactone decarboxylase family protein [Casimicrobiaceae bacterium]